MRPRPARTVYDGDLRVIDIPRHNQNAHDRKMRTRYIVYITKIIDKIIYTDLVFFVSKYKGSRHFVLSETYS